MKVFSAILTSNVVVVSWVTMGFQNVGDSLGISMGELIAFAGLIAGPPTTLGATFGIFLFSRITRLQQSVARIEGALGARDARTN